MSAATITSTIAPPPPIDPELAAPVAALLAELPVPLTPALVADRRARTAAGRLSDEALERRGTFSVEERLVPGPPGAPDVEVLICRPRRRPGPHPVIYNTHGGGMVAGSNRTIELADELDRAEVLGLAVVAVEYRLAPEHPHPAPVEDCYAGLCWIAEHAVDLGLDPSRILVSGNSAGGCLAAALALLARDRGGPALVGQMLQCPMLDDRADSYSSWQLAAAGLWDGDSNRAGFAALLDGWTGPVPASAAPARATDLSGLPPVVIDVGAVEALRDDALDYANRIWQAGGDAELHVWAGAFHSFDHWVPDAAVSRAAKAVRISWLRRVLGRA